MIARDAASIRNRPPSTARQALRGRGRPSVQSQNLHHEDYMNVCRRTASKLGLAALAVSVGISTAATAAEVDVYDGNTHYTITPYLWLPGMTGTLNFALPSGVAIQPSATVKPNSYLSDLQFAIMLAGEVRKGDWALATDLIYTDFADLESHVTSLKGPGGNVNVPVNVGVNLGLRATIWTIVGSYTTIRNSGGTLDVIGGLRYARLENSLDWTVAGTGGIFSRAGSSTESLNLWDGIVGVRGMAILSSDGKWILPFEADIGAGNSNWTWQAYAGLGYRFDWGDLVVSFRNLSFDQSSGKTLEGLRMTGPALSATFRW
jgi:hypothetical protein